MSVKIEKTSLGPVEANCFVVTDEASLLSLVIDPGGFDGSLERLIKDKQIKYILLTHGHYDHILGVYDLKQRTGAEVMIHALDAPCLEDEYESLAARSLYPGLQKCLTADRLLEDGDSVTLGETVLRVMHTPGHTKGSVCYVDEEDRVIFSGDTLFCMTIGRTDLPGGDDRQMLDSLKRLIALDGDYTVCTGHNRNTTLSSERVRNRYIRRML